MDENTAIFDQEIPRSSVPSLQPDQTNKPEKMVDTYFSMISKDLAVIDEQAGEGKLKEEGIHPEALVLLTPKEREKEVDEIRKLINDYLGVIGELDDNNPLKQVLVETLRKTSLLLHKNILRVWSEAGRSEVTGLLKFADKILNSVLERIKEGQRMVVIFLDVDNFTSFNELFGHIRANEILRILGERMRKVLRKGDVVLNPYGDEMVYSFLISDCDNLDQISLSIAERLLKSVGKEPVSIYISKEEARRIKEAADMEKKHWELLNIDQKGKMEGAQELAMKIIQTFKIFNKNRESGKEGIKDQKEDGTLRRSGTDRQNGDTIEAQIDLSVTGGMIISNPAERDGEKIIICDDQKRPISAVQLMEKASTLMELKKTVPKGKNAIWYYTDEGGKVRRNYVKKGDQDVFINEAKPSDFEEEIKLLEPGKLKNFSVDSQGRLVLFFLDGRELRDINPKKAKWGEMPRV